MAGKRLPDESIQAAAEALRQTGGNVMAAARLLNVPAKAFEHWKRLAINRGLVDIEALRAEHRLKTQEVHYTEESKTRLPQSADECWEVIDRWIGRSSKPKTERKSVKVGGRKDYVIAGDTHCPFHEAEAVAKMIADTRGADVFILNGDWTDHHAASRFIKYESVPFASEMAAADATMCQFANSYTEVLATGGNHDKSRLEKLIRGSLPIEAVSALEFLSQTGDFNVLKVLAKRYPNVRFAEMKVGRLGLEWLAQEGDLIVLHAEKFSKIPGSSLRQIHDELMDREELLGLEPWRMVIQAHTHQLGWFPWVSDRLLVEGGCLSQSHGYQLTARMGGRPQRRGWVTLTQYDGRTDFNSVRLFWWDEHKRQIKVA